MKRCLAACLTWLLVVLAAADARTAEPPHAVFVTGDDEYRSEISMPMIARILAQRHGFRTTVCYAVDPATGQRNPKFQQNIVGLEALETADVAIFFLRYRALPDEQLNQILAFVESGKPVVGLRTTTHAFRYQSGPHTAYNDDFGRDVFGQKWIIHHGHRSRTDVRRVDEQANHPILRGVDSKFHATSWLYHVDPLAGNCTPLLVGRAVNSERTDRFDEFPPEQSVAWTKNDRPGRVFFTTLGHPKDFEHEAMRRLLVNGIFWALDREIPPAGLDVVPVEPYQAPPTH